MRIYLPATSDDLADPDGVSPRWGHAITPALRRALPEEDDDGLADSALLAAVDQSIERLRALLQPVPRRVVLAVDVAASGVHVPASGRPWQPGDDQLPSAVEVRVAVPWRDVASIHVDEHAACSDVAAAIADDDALDRAAERDLLWHDIGEREVLAADLTDVG